MKVEFFDAGCRLCQRALSTLTGRFPSIKIEVHRAAECMDGSCCALAAQYEVRAVPSLVVDGKVVLVGVPEEGDIQALSGVLRR